MTDNQMRSNGHPNTGTDTDTDNSSNSNSNNTEHTDHTDHRAGLTQTDHLNKRLLQSFFERLTRAQHQVAADQGATSPADQQDTGDWETTPGDSTPS